jgi:hypothetical protein
MSLELGGDSRWLILFFRELFAREIACGCAVPGMKQDVGLEQCAAALLYALADDIDQVFLLSNPEHNVIS